MNNLLVNNFNYFLENSNINKLKLSQKENEVVYLVSKGYKNKKIGEVLFISENTVKKHIYNIFIKLNINSRFELLCMVSLNNNSNQNFKAS